MSEGNRYMTGNFEKATVHRYITGILEKATVYRRRTGTDERLQVSVVFENEQDYAEFQARLAELEQAERERDEAQRLAECYERFSNRDIRNAALAAYEQAQQEISKEETSE